MLIKQNRTISFICPDCGLSNFVNISLFDFSGKTEFNIVCKCKQSHLKISTTNYKKYKINTPCIGCSSTHSNVLDFYNMWVKPLHIIKCSLNNTEILFIGNDEEVAMQLDELEAKKDEIAAIIGFEKIFVNSSVMLAIINKIHEISEKNEIICECGSNEIVIDTSEDKLVLKCAVCGALEIISAKSSLDLKNIEQKSSIILFKNKQYI